MEKSRICTYLIRSNFFFFIGFFLFLHFLVQLPFLCIDFSGDGDVLNNSAIELLEKDGKAVVLYTTVIFAPLLETFVFQFSIIKGFRLISKRTWVMIFLAIPISAVLFSFAHDYSIYYQVAAFFVGLIFASAFLVGIYRKDWPAFFLVFMIHSCWNLFAFVMEELTA